MSWIKIWFALGLNISALCLYRVLTLPQRVLTANFRLRQMSHLKLAQASWCFATHLYISWQIEFQPGVTSSNLQGLSLPFLLWHMLLTCPENCAMEACGVVIPCAAGVNCKEPLMRLPVNTLCWTVTVAEEAPGTPSHSSVGCGVSGSAHSPCCREFPQKGKRTCFFSSLFPRRKCFHLIGFSVFLLSLTSIQYLFLLMFYNRYVIYCLSSLKIYVTLRKHVLKALEPKIN